MNLTDFQCRVTMELFPLLLFGKGGGERGGYRFWEKFKGGRRLKLGEESIL